MSLRPLLIAIQFLTRFPVRLKQAPDEQEMGYAVVYFPLVGLCIGLVLWLVFKVMLELQAPPWLSAALVLTTWVLSTGGLHLDGLADSVDAWAGGGCNRERILAIMKDPTCGAMAVIAIFLVLILKLAALAGLQTDNQALFILIVPVLGRAVLPLLFLTTPYVRPEGLGAAMAAHLPHRWAVAAVAGTWLGVIIYSRLVGVYAIIISMIVYGMMRRKMLSTIGGVTGDTAGALVEITEAVTLVAIVLSINL